MPWIVARRTQNAMLAGSAAPPPALPPKGASVILTGSAASIKGSFGVYNATKAALRSVARTWIIDLKGPASTRSAPATSRPPA